MLTVVSDPQEATKDAHAILILTEWNEFIDFDWEQIYENMLKPAFIFDGRRLLDRSKMTGIGFSYYKIGES